MRTIVAIFDDISVARQLIEDLVMAGFTRDSISLVTNDSQNQYSRFLEKDYVPRVEAVTALEGAGLGMIVGALTGILLSLVAFFIPALRLAINPIVYAVLGAVLGALLGAVIGAVIKITVPEDLTPYYAEAIKRGATLISIRTNTPRQANEVLHRYGTIDLHERISQWRQTGWHGFDAPAEVEEAQTQPWHILNVMTEARTSTQLSPMLPLATVEPAPVIESIIEPELSEEDTEKSIAIPGPESLPENSKQNDTAAPVAASREHPFQG